MTSVVMKEWCWIKKNWKLCRQATMLWQRNKRMAILRVKVIEKIPMKINARPIAVIMKTNVMTLPGKYLHTVELRRHYICLIPWKLRCPKEKDKSKNFKHTLHTILKHNCSKFCSERFHLHLCFLHLGSDAGYWPPSRCRPNALDHVPRRWHL